MIPSLCLQPGFLEGWVRHSRYQPKPHQYTVNTVWVCIDIDELSTFGQNLPYWNFNGTGLHTLSRSQFIGSTGTSIRSAVESQLRHHNILTPARKILAITACKNMGFGKNPAEFYLIHDDDTNLFAIIAHLKNSKNESYPYTFAVNDQNNLCFQSKKALYISGHTPMNVVYIWQFYIGKRHFMMNLHIEKPLDPNKPKVNSLLFPAKARQDAMNNKLMGITMSSTLKPFAQETAKSLGLKYAMSSFNHALSRFWTSLVLNENGFPEKHPSTRGEPHPQEIESPITVKGSKRIQ